MSLEVRISFAALGTALLLNSFASEFSGASEHWAFKKLDPPTVPVVREGSWPQNEIDNFILARLEKEGLSPSNKADRGALIRRLSFDLLGLPPTPEQVRSFVEDADPKAYEKLVDQFLASPHYGERWARHWLDVVRFAESAGFETNLERKNAWPYRDYVIESFNSDKPYDQFIREQIAGDALGADRATGFLVGGPWDAVKSPDINLTAQQRMDELHDMVSTTGSAFLGVTLGCARCHDHKFDPIRQVDYYSVQAVFAGVQHGERMLRPPDYEERVKHASELREKIGQLRLALVDFEPLANPNLAVGEQIPQSKLRAPVHPKGNTERVKPAQARALRFTIRATSGAEPCIDELEVFTPGPNATNVALASFGTQARASGTYSGNEFHKLDHINDGKFGNKRSWISSENGKGWVELRFPSIVQIERIAWARDREGHFADRLPTNYLIEVAVNEGEWKTIASSGDRLPYKPGEKLPEIMSEAGLNEEQATQVRKIRKELRLLEEELQTCEKFPMIYAGKFEQPAATHRLHRGEPLQKREQVSPGGIKAFGAPLLLSDDTPEQERRLALARWITDPGNPLTARVMANRIWKYHFGEGLVATPSDFGLNGSKPTHPELVDWLASELIHGGWRLKRIHRMIVLSNTYQQSSEPNSLGLQKDSASRLLWRFPPRRLEAEPLRDAILMVSGNLDMRMGGPGFDLFEPNGNYVKVYNSKTNFTAAEWRRMVYQSKPRMQLDSTFGAFDCPDAGQIAPTRTVSTTPLQALNLLNSPFSLQQAEIFANRLKTEAGEDPRAQVERGFWLAFNRAPSKEELEAGTRFVKSEGTRLFCRALFNANEFLYIY